MGEPTATRSPSLAELVEAWCRRQGLGQPDACPRCLEEARLHWTLSGWRCGDCRAELVIQAASNDPDDWAPCQGHPPQASAGFVGCSDHWPPPDSDPPDDHGAPQAEASAEDTDP